MKLRFTHDDTRPAPVVRKEQYTLYCELLIRIAAHTATQSDWIPVTTLCDEFAVGTGSMQRPLFFLASHGWVRLLTDAEGYVTDVAMTPRGWQHRAVEG
jgi:hypothetical protein